MTRTRKFCTGKLIPPCAFFSLSQLRCCSFYQRKHKTNLKQLLFLNSLHWCICSQTSMHRCIQHRFYWLMQLRLVKMRKQMRKSMQCNALHREHKKRCIQFHLLHRKSVSEQIAMDWLFDPVKSSNGSGIYWVGFNRFRIYTYLKQW